MRMKTVDQIGRGVANFFDEEVRPSLSGGGLAAEPKSQMQKNGGVLTVTIMGDTFSFRQPDVDALMRCIERA